MSKKQVIVRIVPNIYSDDLPKSKEFYTVFLGMNLAMDMDWMLTFVSETNPTAQISIFKNEANKPLNNSAIFLSIELENVDEMHQIAIEQNIEIVYPIRNEPWGVRRFFVKGPNGETINILSHLK
jgi:catechol 2,3-dioxygenase-like lactoylglutathione lyase family enzyme